MIIALSIFLAIAPAQAAGAPPPGPVPARPSPAPPAQFMAAEADVAAVLERHGVDPWRVRIQPHDLDLLDTQPPRTPLLDWLFASPLKIPLLKEYVADAFNVDWPGDCVDAFATLSRWRGRTVRRGLVGDALERPRKLAAVDDPLGAAVERIYKLGGKTLDDAAREKLKQCAAAAPPDQLSRLAVLLQTMCDAHEWADLAFEDRPAEAWSALLAQERRPEEKDAVKSEASPFEEFRTLRRSAEAVAEFDASLPLVGAEEIVLAVEDFAAPYVRAAVELRKKGAGFGAADGRSGAGQPAESMNVSDLLDADKTPPPTNWGLVLETPLGLISIGDKHELGQPAQPAQPAEPGAAAPAPAPAPAPTPAAAMAPFLLIDWGGDDSYARLASNTAPVQRVSVAIELGGNDTYKNDDPRVGGFGAGHLGLGMLFDFAGDDTYEIKRNGLGQALFGAALLYDDSGNDKYVAVEKAQAYAVAGVAMVVDVAGDDKYDIYNAGQGFGGPGGAAALVDRAGGDRYIANDADIRFPSAQSAEHNTSMVQGAGYGWRGDYLQGLSAAGGVGLLLDERGNDIYACGVFGQGVGYWFGAGLLMDLDGNDRYAGQWYVQGASAHFAAGVLLDAAGDDAYEGVMNMALGAGHDVGVGALFDLDGNDRYRGGGLSLGAGNASGVGILLDRAGADGYTLANNADNAMGYVTPEAPTGVRKVIQGVGLFLDLGGLDGYSLSRAANNATWVSPAAAPATVLPGVARGIDVEAGGPTP